MVEVQPTAAHRDKETLVGEVVQHKLVPLLQPQLVVRVVMVLHLP
jgi:hypothetical protein